MTSYVGLTGGTGFQWNSNNNFRSSIRVRGVDNVIDVVFIHRDGRAVSIDLNRFASVVNHNSITETDVRFVPRCNDDAKEPVLIRETGRDNFRNTFTTYGSGSWHANDSGEDDEVSNWDHGFRDGVAFDALRQADPNWGTSDGRCTEFSLLYHRLDALTNMFHRGYQLFNMNNYNGWQNWVAYPSSGGGYYIYALVMYLSADNYAKVLGCFNGQRNDMESTVERLFGTGNGLTNRSSMLAMGNAFCSNPIPFYSFLSQGNYYMGTTIYSPNTRFKLFLQPDGNLVAYAQMNATSSTPSESRAYWSSNTFRQVDGNFTVRPILAVQSDGNVVLYRQQSNEARVLTQSGPIWHANTRGSDVRLGIANNGDIYVFTGHPQTNNLNILWSSSGNITNTRNSIVSNFEAFNSKCTNNNYKTSNNDLNILKYRYEYCSQGTNPYTDDNCRRLFGGYTVSGDSNGLYKRSMDDTVKQLCSRVTATSPEAYRDFCACVNPLGDAKTIFQSFKYHPKCWEPKCINNGYKLEEFQTEANKCPTSLCIQDIKLINVIQKEGSSVQMTCNAGTTSSTKRDITNSPSTLCGSLAMRGKCINAGENGLVSIQECVDDNNVNAKYQKFQYNPNTLQLRTAWGGSNQRCLNVSGGNIENNAQINITNCDNSDAQKFLYDIHRKQFVSNKDQTKCVDLKGGDITNGNTFQIRDCVDNSNAQVINTTECSETSLQNLLYSANLPIETNNRCGTASLDVDNTKCINLSKDNLKVEDCTTYDTNKKVFMYNAIDSTIRDYHNGEDCLESDSNGNLMVKQCEDIRVFNETGQFVNIPARQKFLFNTSTNQLHSGTNHRRCIGATLSNGNYNLTLMDCNANNNQKFNFGSVCSNSVKTTLATNEASRLQRLQQEALNARAEIERLALEAKLAEEARLKAIEDENERQRQIEIARLKAIEDERLRVLAEEENRARLEKERLLLEESERIRLEEENARLAKASILEAEKKALELAMAEAESDSSMYYIIAILILFVCIIITFIVLGLNKSKYKGGEGYKIWGADRVNLRL